MTPPAGSAAPLSDAAEAEARGPRRRRGVVVLLGLSALANGAALALPFLDFDAAFSRARSYGLFGSVQMLWEAKLPVLAALVVVFSIVFPLAKLGVLAWVWWGAGGSSGQRRALRWVEAAGKWSMFDVFLTAILLGLVHDQVLVSAAAGPGLVAFLVAVVLAMIAGEWLARELPAAASAPLSARKLQHGRAAPLLLWGTLVALLAALAVPFLALDDWRMADRAFSLGLLPWALAGTSVPVAVACGLFLVVTPLAWWAALRSAVHTTAGSAAPLRRAQWLARWSMLDVFALALLVFSIEGSSFVQSEVRVGALPLAVVVGLTWTLAYLTQRRAR